MTTFYMGSTPLTDEVRMRQQKYLFMALRYRFWFIESHEGEEGRKNNIIVFYVLSLLFNLRHSCREFNGTRNHGSIFPFNPHQRSIRSHKCPYIWTIMWFRHATFTVMEFLFYFHFSPPIRPFVNFAHSTMHCCLVLFGLPNLESWIRRKMENHSVFPFSKYADDWQLGTRLRRHNSYSNRNGWL